MLLVAAAGCRQDEAAPTAVSPAAEATAVVTNTPAPTPTPSPEPSPTPILPAITVSDQPLADDGRLTVERVSLPEPGWLIVYAQQDGERGDQLDAVALPVGTTRDVPVTVDPFAATETLIAALHVDGGERGAFEYPGPDEPFVQAETPVTAIFTVEMQVVRPSISVNDQTVGEDGVVQVEQVVVPARGWVVVHADDEGALGPVLGAAPAAAGRTESLAVGIPWREATTRLYAVLYEDLGTPHRFDLDEDLPFLAAGELALASFDVTLPPDVFALDQPVIDGAVMLERVTIDRPGWAVIYFDDEEAPGRIIGSAPLEAGVNEQVQVAVLETAVTPILYVILHEDVTPGDEFDFPASDPPIAENGRLVEPIPFRTDPGNYLITRDQSLPAETNTVTVPLAVVDIAAWMAIHADDDGQRGEIIGVSPLAPGINRDVVVELDGAAVTETVYAVLYLDAGEIGEFEFPDGPDVALQRNRAVIQVPFSVTPAEDERPPINPH